MVLDKSVISGNVQDILYVKMIAEKFSMRPKQGMLSIPHVCRMIDGVRLLECTEMEHLILIATEKWQLDIPASITATIQALPSPKMLTEETITAQIELVKDAVLYYLEICTPKKIREKVV